VLAQPDNVLKKRMLKKQRYMNQYHIQAPRLCLESFRNLQENYVLPTLEEGFDEIQYAELDENSTKKLVALMNEQASLEIHPLLREKNYEKINLLMDDLKKAGSKSD